MKRFISAILSILMLITLVPGIGLSANTHRHSWSEWYILDTADCEKDGIKYRYCTECKESDVEITDRLDHNWIIGENTDSYGWYCETEPNCTQTGKEVRECSRCGKKENREVPATGHNNEWITIQEATCTTDDVGQEGIDQLICKNCGEIFDKKITPAPEHEWIINDNTDEEGWEVIAEAYCNVDEGSVNGLIKRTCSRCGKEETIETKPLHELSDDCIVVSPTCTKEGYKAGICVICEQYISKITLNALGHGPFSEWETTKEPTCTEEGEEIRICTVCEGKEDGGIESKSIKKIPHIGEWVTVKEPTCTEKGQLKRICEVCGFEETKDINLLGHNWTQWVETKQANCTEDGEKTHFCMRCKKLETEVIPAWGHNWHTSDYSDKEGWEEIWAPTCEEVGSECRYCTVCKTEESRDIPALGHSWIRNEDTDEEGWIIDEEPTCTGEGLKHRICGREIEGEECGYIENADVEALGHYYTQWVVVEEASCTKDGVQLRACKRCNIIEKETIPAAHTEGEWITEIEAKCEEDGISRLHCAVCDEVIDEQILSATGHTEGEWVTVKEASCEENGLRQLYCAECNKILDEETVTATGHKLGEWETVKAATCTEKGISECKCENCDYTETKDIEVLGHKFGDWNVKLLPTELKEGYEERICTVCGEVEGVVIPVLEKTNPFKDLEADAWYTESALWCKYSGYMTGVTETSFEPKSNITRAQFVQIIAKIDGVDLTMYDDRSTFTDVLFGKWYHNAVEWANEYGIAVGNGNGTFSPNKAVTRQQIAVILYAYSEKKGVDMNYTISDSTFKDAGDISDWAVNAMNWAVANKLISGVGEGYLAPNGFATRGQVAVMIKAYCENVLSK
ncbi:MAG: S-layer homology domain-containing protein [Clostridia bacterium]|nr:S-layer homology domain-containing protein [Clostridia bacterium]